ncbi:xylanase [Luteitalea sp. TBR-22]|uniref:alpha/beta hydrolase n=1 Tax=Luteitalea sp. TBR-22 TaxID=2802971 RepID=UPI001AF256D9|nr:alpha/beta hydrolase [Luteitalea sp. TBR-22]BCS31684.1 xylanase [Luteitalea sp. TBR-22]
MSRSTREAVTRAFLLVAIGCLAGTSQQAQAQEHVLPLYDRTMPNARPTTATERVEARDITWITNVRDPQIAVFLPTRKFATGQAVIICPGGGYGGLAYDLEGTDIARSLNAIGVAGVVLKYRLPSTDGSVEPHKTPLLDATRAMRLVRSRAAQWNIDPARIGIMGFSAGGHLASTLGTHFDNGDATAADPVDRLSSRPDFMILMYPVISFVDAAAHTGSRKNLLGDAPPPDRVAYYSNELQVTSETPPTFLVHASDDTAVPVDNSLLMYKALRRARVPAELHVLSEGGHGFGLALDNAHVASWTTSLKLWLQALATPAR